LVLNDPAVAVTVTGSPGKTAGAVALHARVTGGAFLQPIGKKARHAEASTRLTYFQFRDCISIILRSQTENQSGKVRSLERLPVKQKTIGFDAAVNGIPQHQQTYHNEAAAREDFFIQSPPAPPPKKRRATARQRSDSHWELASDHAHLLHIQSLEQAARLALNLLL
jgi:hypothetical protein